MNSWRHGAWVAVLALIVGAAGVAGQGDAWLVKSPQLKTATFKDPNGRFSVDYPAKSWIRLPGAGSTLLTLSEEDVEATIVVEVVPMDVPLAPDEVTTLFAELEAVGVRKREKNADEFVQRVITAGARRVAVVEYTRRGTKGIERVRQYSFPVGANLYRMACSTGVQRLKKYAPVFSHVAASFAPAP
ncbi:MAG: hypothetical protein U0Q12_15225 [Vicinamibacterales bacterium]